MTSYFFNVSTSSIFFVKSLGPWLLTLVPIFPKNFDFNQNEQSWTIWSLLCLVRIIQWKRHGGVATWLKLNLDIKNFLLKWFITLFICLCSSIPDEFLIHLLLFYYDHTIRDKTKHFLYYLQLFTTNQNHIQVCYL